MDVGVITQAIKKPQFKVKRNPFLWFTASGVPSYGNNRLQITRIDGNIPVESMGEYFTITDGGVYLVLSKIYTGSGSLFIEHPEDLVTGGGTYSAQSSGFYTMVVLINNSWSAVRMVPRSMVFVTGDLLDQFHNFEIIIYKVGQ